MQLVTHYPDGVFNWIDLTTTDIQGAKAFYGGVFGWAIKDLPLGEGSYYTYFLVDGQPVAGGGQMMPDQQAAGVPPTWTAYVKFDDMAGAVARAEAAGATVMVPPMQIFDNGSMAVLMDPTGAVFGIWQPDNFPGAALVNRPGALAWTELQTRDLSLARDFYKQVFNWNEAPVDMPGGSEYFTFAAGDRVQCGSMGIEESWGDVPPHWDIYIAVDDIDATCAKVAELGGTVVAGPMEGGGMGRFAILRDPQGAHITAMQFSVPLDPPPGY